MKETLSIDPKHLQEKIAELEEEFTAEKVKHKDLYLQGAYDAIVFTEYHIQTLGLCRDCYNKVTNLLERGRITVKALRLDVIKEKLGIAWINLERPEKKN